VQFNREALANALNLLTSIVPERTPKPILRCVRINADAKDVHVYGTDLEVGINYLLAAVQVDKPGDIVVPAGSLAAIVRESTDDILVIESKDGGCEVRGQDSHFTIFGHEPDQYPLVPAFDGKPDIEIPLDTLQAATSQVLFATAKESSRYAINGVLWEIKGKKLSLVATDGRRLAKSKINLANAPAEKIAAAKVIVPGKTMGLLEKISGSGKDSVAVRLVDNRILIACGTLVISSNLVEGNFPKYDDIIPTDYQKKMRLPTELVLSAVRRAALLTSEESRGIKLAVGKKAVVFTGRAPEAGDAEVDMPIDYSGEPIEIGFNPQFLADALRVIRESEFEMELGQADTPGLIKSGTNFLYVLMPINLG